ncbi:MAG TPA: CsgG/HfaB family protein [Gemmatimonadales bacterium]|nr:CsgG/HfaB family protein [Gemmatimonadales bacterium]
MGSSPLVRARHFFVSLFAVFASACGSIAPETGATPATNTAALERAAASHATDTGANLRLARAYYSDKRYPDARRVLGTTLGLEPGNREALVYLGLTYEALTQYDSARAVYTGLLANHPSKSLRHLLTGRLEIIGRAELVYAARDALAHESSFAQLPPEPNTVAVMPFRYAGGDSAFKPLERGLAAVFVTDLSQVHTLRVVERARLQALLDEMQLAQSDRVDPATGARSGRLLRAGQVIEGQFTTDSGAAATRVRIDATVVRAADAAVSASGSNSDRLQSLFDVEKAVVLQLLADLGVTLTPAERVAITQRPTRDLEAFLLYSRGLEEADRGDFSAAANSFQAAASRDPGFGAAVEGARSSSAAQAASAVPAGDLAAAAGPPATTSPLGAGGQNAGALSNAIDGTVPSGAGVLASTTAPATPPTDPNRICEGATCDGPARAALIGAILIIFKIP